MRLGSKPMASTISRHWAAGNLRRRQYYQAAEKRIRFNPCKAKITKTRRGRPYDLSMIHEGVEIVFTNFWLTANAESVMQLAFRQTAECEPDFCRAQLQYKMLDLTFLPLTYKLNKLSIYLLRQPLVLLFVVFRTKLQTFRSQ